MRLTYLLKTRGNGSKAPAVRHKTVKRPTNWRVTLATTTLATMIACAGRSESKTTCGQARNSAGSKWEEWCAAARVVPSKLSTALLRAIRFGLHGGDDELFWSKPALKRNQVKTHQTIEKFRTSISGKSEDTTVVRIAQGWRWKHTRFCMTHLYSTIVSVDYRQYIKSLVLMRSSLGDIPECVPRGAKKSNGRAFIVCVLGIRVSTIIVIRLSDEGIRIQPVGNDRMTVQIKSTNFVKSTIIFKINICTVY